MINIRKVSVMLVIIKTIAHKKPFFNIMTIIIDGYFLFSIFMFVYQGTHLD